MKPNVLMLTLGVLLLAVLVWSRGLSGPAWWWPPVKPDLPKVVFAAGPAFALLLIVAAFKPASGSGGSGLWGIAVAVLLVLLLVAVFAPLPDWVKPGWYKSATASAAHNRTGVDPYA